LIGPEAISNLDYPFGLNTADPLPLQFFQGKTDIMLVFAECPG
jgi:hypothetical protein